MRCVLDSNEFIFSLGPFRKSSCVKMLDTILERPARTRIFIPRMIVEEVRRNLSTLAFKEFMAIVRLLTDIDDDTQAPFELGAKYESRGLKPADAFIGAYAEWVGADVLVSENRHFLLRQKDLPFKTLNAESFLEFL